MEPPAHPPHNYGRLLTAILAVLFIPPLALMLWPLEPDSALFGGQPDAKLFLLAVLGLGFALNAWRVLDYARNREKYRP